MIRLHSILLFSALSCLSFQTASADLAFYAFLDASQVTGTSTEPGTAIATFVLDTAQQNLSYSIQVNGMDLKANPADRTGFSDIDKIHIHNAFPGDTGPHVLNIFGLPSEDDAEMVVNYNTEFLTGIYNDADAINPATGNLFDQNDPLTTKLFSNFVDDLLDGQLYVAMHTAGQGGGIAVRGQILSVPEPTGGVLLFAIGSIYCRRRRVRRV